MKQLYVNYSIGVFHFYSYFIISNSIMLLTIMGFYIYIMFFIHFIEKIQIGCCYFTQLETETQGTRHGTVLRQMVTYSQISEFHSSHLLIFTFKFKKNNMCMTGVLRHCQNIFFLKHRIFTLPWKICSKWNLAVLSSKK